MGILDAFWHLLNFFAPALAVGWLTAAVAKLMWRKHLRSVSWVRLAIWASASGAAGLIAALVVLGRDGRMLGYAAMLSACSVSLWWLMLRASRA